MYAELMIAWYTAVSVFAEARSLTVEWPNQEFTRPGDGLPFLRPQSYNIEAESIDVHSAERHKFILQLSVYVRDNTGTVPAMELADQLRLQFPLLHVFETKNYAFEVTKAPTPAPPVNEPGWMAVPVSLEVMTLTP